MCYAALPFCQESRHDVHRVLQRSQTVACVRQSCWCAKHHAACCRTAACCVAPSRFCKAAMQRMTLIPSYCCCMVGMLSCALMWLLNEHHWPAKSLWAACFEGCNRLVACWLCMPQARMLQCCLTLVNVWITVKTRCMAWWVQQTAIQPTQTHTWVRWHGGAVQPPILWSQHTPDTEQAMICSWQCPLGTRRAEQPPGGFELQDLTPGQPWQPYSLSCWCSMRYKLEACCYLIRLAGSEIGSAALRDNISKVPPWKSLQAT